MDALLTGEMLLERMVRAVEAVRDRLRRGTAALEQAQIPYAVIGGNAVAAWVARVDPSAVRNTQDVDILLRRSDLERAKSALEGAGFVYCQVVSIDMFLDGPGARPRDAIHIIFAGEKVRPEYTETTPDVVPFDLAPPFHIVSLENLVRMKLTSFRLKDQVHIQDMIGVGLVDETWPDRLTAQLAERLREILAKPEG
jgi:hypothetical protein